MHTSARWRGRGASRGPAPGRGCVAILTHFPRYHRASGWVAFGWGAVRPQLCPTGWPGVDTCSERTIAVTTQLGVDLPEVGEPGHKGTPGGPAVDHFDAGHVRPP